MRELQTRQVCDIWKRAMSYNTSLEWSHAHSILYGMCKMAIEYDIDAYRELATLMEVAHQHALDRIQEAA